MTLNALPIIAWNNRILDATLTVSTEATGYPKENLYGLRPAVPWYGTGASEQTITLTFGSPTPASCVGISGHNLHTIGAANVVLQYFDGSWKDCHAAWTPTNNRTWWMAFTARNVTDYRLKIPAGYTAPPWIGVLFVGTYLTLPAWPSGDWDPDYEEAERNDNYSRDGHYMGNDVRYRNRKFVINIDYLSDAFVQASLIPWRDWAVGKPFFVIPERGNHPTAVYYMMTEPKFATPWNKNSRRVSIPFFGLREP